MALLGTQTKQPAERLDYDLPYADWMTDGDGIASSNNVDVQITTLSGTDTTPLTLYRIDVAPDARVKVWLASGTNGCVYKIEVTLTTDDGRIKQDEFRLKVKEI